jgi:hypothetical protein
MDIKGIKMPRKKTDFNNRMKTSEVRKKRKKGEGFITTQFEIEEILDESGEVMDDTIIRFSFGGLWIHLSIASAMKFNKMLNDVLNLKR